MSFKYGDIVSRDVLRALTNPTGHHLITPLPQALIQDTAFQKWRLSVTYYLHETPGRLRVRTPILKRNIAEARRVLDTFTKIRGVRKITTNTTTGSITIRYCELTLCPSQIINHLCKHGFIEGIIGFPRKKSPRKKAEIGGVYNYDFIYKNKPTGISPRSYKSGPTMNATPLQNSISPQTKKFLAAAAKIVLPILAERAFGKTGREIVSALL